MWTCFWTLHKLLATLPFIKDWIRESICFLKTINFPKCVSKLKVSLKKVARSLIDEKISAVWWLYRSHVITNDVIHNPSFYYNALSPPSPFIFAFFPGRVFLHTIAHLNKNCIQPSTTVFLAFWHRSNVQTKSLWQRQDVIFTQIINNWEHFIFVLEFCYYAFGSDQL